jgi:ketosteroid isomerase-like protein
MEAPDLTAAFQSVASLTHPFGVFSMSRRLVISLTLAGVAALGCRGAPQYITAADRAALHATQDSIAARMQRGDSKAMAAGFGANAKVMAPNEPMVAGRPAIEAMIRAYPHFTTFTLTVDTVAGMGDLAVVRGHYHLSLMPPVVPQAVVDSGKYLQVLWRQADGSWLVADEMYNSDIPLPPPPTPMKKNKN